jgi:hypothetical protein
MKKKKKTIEIQVPFDTLKELLTAHLYAISYLNDDQEVTELKWKRGIDLKNMLTFDLTLISKEPLQLPLLEEDGE